MYEKNDNIETRLENIESLLRLILVNNVINTNDLFQESVKLKVFVEFKNGQIEQKTLVNKAEKIWENEDNIISDIKTMDLYYKPEENRCYVVYNIGLPSERKLSFKVI